MKSFTQKKRYKPLYKKFKQVFENVQLRQKIFNFRKQKWRILIERLKKAKYYYRKYKIFNHSGNMIVPLVIYRKPPKFQKRYKYLMHVAKKFKLFYGDFKKKYIRKKIKFLLYKQKKNIILGNIDYSFLNFMERRLENVLYRSFFTKSVKTARQLILHGHVSVNNKAVKHGSYILKKYDLIEINPKFHNFILFNIKKSKCWPIQLNSLLINYKTLQIVFIDRPNLDSFTNLFPFKITIKNIIKHFKYH